MIEQGAQPSEWLPEWTSPPDLERIFNIPVATWYAWRYKGVGPKAVRLGKHLRYHRPDVLRWLEEQQERVG